MITEGEFIEKYEQDKQMLEAWGNYVQKAINKRLSEELGSSEQLCHFLRVPCKPRIKENASILAKAFSRGKVYSDPYAEIADKVGIRYVVLLQEDIRTISSIIESIQVWKHSKDRDFEEERLRKPLVFEYQSVHYVVCSKGEISISGIIVSANTPCEIQIRTLLQHAYSELTHDTIYKSNLVVEPNVHRVLAKSMALIETTNEFFTEVNFATQERASKNRGFINGLAELYSEFLVPEFEKKTNEYILDSLSSLLQNTTIEDVAMFLIEQPYVKVKMSERHDEKILFRQPIVLIIYYLVSVARNDLKAKWPLTQEELSPFFADMGFAL